MKQKLLLKTMLLLFALIASSSSVWAADVTGTINFGSASGSTAINSTSVTGNDSQGNEWTITTVMTQTSFTQNASYSQVGASSKPATSITFTTTLPKSQTIKAFSAKFGGFSSTAGDVTLKVGSTTVGSGSLNETTDVVVSATNTTTSGTVLTVTVTNIAKGVKCYYISYTYENSTPTHTLTYSATNGSIAGVGAGSVAVASGASVGEGATVTLTATPSSGYVFSSWSVSGTGSTLSSTTTNPTTFTMGTANATVTANFEVDNSVATPTFDPDGSATYTQAQNVAISCATGGATIHYTTNGDDPTESDPIYSSPVSITTSKTVLKAKAFKGGMTASDVASATYTIKPSKPTVTAVGATVTITGQESCTFYYTTDGTTPTNSSTEYTGSFDLLSDCTIKARAYDAYNNASDVYSFSFKYYPLNPKNINSGYFIKVTDVSDLENGDAILIVNETANAAMSTDQKTNNRGQANVTITNNVINTPSANVQKLVLVKTTEEINSVDTEVFYFYTGSGYLYAASNTSNYLKTETTPDNKNNARATIAISISTGDATIQFTGDNSRKWLKYNSLSTLFSCYATDDETQSIVQIYKEVAHSETLTPTNTYTTLTSAYNLDFTSVSDDLKAYIATGVSGGYVQMTQVNKVPANTGLVLRATTPDSPVNVPAFDGTGADDVTGNLMAGSATATTAVAANAGYILKDGVFQPSSGGDLPAGKAYLNIAVSSAPVLNLSFDDVTGDGNTTGVNDVRSKMEEGRGEFYNLNGQRVAQPTKGLYIVNGKKYVVK